MFETIKIFLGLNGNNQSPNNQGKRVKKKHSDEIPEIQGYTRYEIIVGINKSKNSLERATKEFDKSKNSLERTIRDKVRDKHALDLKVWQMHLQLLDRSPNEEITHTKEYWLAQCLKYLDWIRQNWQLFIGDKFYAPRLKNSQKTLAEFMKNGGVVFSELGVTQGEFDQLMALPETFQEEETITPPLPERKVSTEQEDSGAKVISLVPYIEKHLRAQTR